MCQNLLADFQARPPRLQTFHGDVWTDCGVDSRIIQHMLHHARLKDPNSSYRFRCLCKIED